MPSSANLLLQYRLRKLRMDLHRASSMLWSKGPAQLLRRLGGMGPATGAGNAATAPLPALPVDGVARAAAPLRLLWIDEHLPDPGRDSGSLRMFNLMRVMLAMGHQVDCLSLAPAGRPGQERLLADAGIDLPLPTGGGRRNPAAWLLDAASGYHGIIVSRYHAAYALFPLLRSVAPQARLVLDTVDLHHVREQREALHRRSRAQLRSAARTRELELRCMAMADCTWLVSEDEQRIALGACPQAATRVVSNVHQAHAAVPGPQARSGLLFVGGAKHPPNVDAVRWLVGELLPALRCAGDSSELHLVGEGLREAVGAAEAPGLRFHGHVPDMGGLLRACRAGLAPLRFGAGIKGKVNQYMAHGLPTIATGVAVEGMHLVDGEDVLLADDAARFVAAVARLADDATWSRLSLRGLDNVRRHFSPAVAAAAVEASFGPHATHATGR